MKIKEGKFYSYPEVLILASQIDGDNASGYNKFGYQLSIVNNDAIAIKTQFMMKCLVRLGSDLEA